SGLSESQRLLFVDVTFKNTGNARLDASVAPSDLLAQEFEGSVHLAGSLLLRKIQAPAKDTIAHVDWWSGEPGILAAPLPEVDLLAEYTDANGVTEFFMEP